MKLPKEIFGDVVVVHTPEEVGEDQSEMLVKLLTSQSQRQVVVDLDRTELIASAGLEALIDAQEKLREQNGDLRITTTNTVNRKILEITRLDQQFEVFDSVLDAVKSYA